MQILPLVETCQGTNYFDFENHKVIYNWNLQNTQTTEAPYRNNTEALFMITGTNRFTEFMNMLVPCCLKSQVLFVRKSFVECTPPLAEAVIYLGLAVW